MSQLLPTRRRPAPAKRAFVLIASRFNAKYVQGLVDHCTNELRARSPGCEITLHSVPGAFEIPIVAREIAAKKNADAIVALGVILEGETAHARHLGESVTNALQRIALLHGVPVIHAVLSLLDEEQARARCLENKINRGTEAARAAIEIAGVLADLRK